MYQLDKDTKILLDSDVIRHFIKGQKLQLLFSLYGNHLVFIDVVKNELFRSKQIVNHISNFISFNKIQVLPFPTDIIEILKEFSRLKKRYGDGESACMAVAKYQKHIIASSNLRDIKQYCEENKIVYITTMDILLDALDKEILTEDECNRFISQVKKRNSKLPVDTIDEYKKMREFGYDS
jgi:predicted nucleic acid-binding protein